MSSFGTPNPHRDALQSMRKHRSLDSSQFLGGHLDPPPPPTFGDGAYFDVHSDGLDTNYASYLPYMDTDHRFQTNLIDFPPPQPHFSAFGGAFSPEVEMLRRELVSTEEKLNYVMNTIRSFWSPELKKERQLRKDEAMRTNALQFKLCQQASEISQIRSELEKRERDISALLDDSGFGEMEAELHLLRKQLREPAPRDFTDQRLSAHEFQTMKAKMERSEVALSEASRHLTSCEVRLKCAEEQSAEVEKRNEILARTTAAQETQLKLLSQDLEVLRKKLETKNQLLEGKERNVKQLEKELDTAKNQLQEAAQQRQESDHRQSSLAHRIEQLETLVRERDAQADRLKQRLMQTPGTRQEKEFQLRAENAEHDKINLERLIENLQQNAEAERQKQLKTFHEESQQLHKTIDYLQKELSDRHVLIASQNEKISQLDTQTKSAENVDAKDAKSVKELESELEETRKEVERLLCIVRSLEKEKGLRLADTAQEHRENDNTPTFNELPSASAESSDLRTQRLRIEELEEALRESILQTSERDKVISEQKPLIQQLSAQVNELYKVSGSRIDQKALQNATAKAEALQKQLEEERAAFERQLSNLRKEVGMEIIKEKEACIALLQSPPDSIGEKIEVLSRQKELLKHRLLTGAFSTSEGGPYLGNIWQGITKLPPFAGAQKAGVGRPLNVSTTTRFADAGASAPASLLYGYKDEAEDDDGIWA